MFTYPQIINPSFLFELFLELKDRLQRVLRVHLRAEGLVGEER